MSENAMITVRSNKKPLLDRDFELLLLSGVSSLSVQPIANIAQKSHGKNCGTMLLIMAIRAQSVSKLFFVNSVDLLLGTGYVIYVVVMLNVFQYIYVLIIHHWYVTTHFLPSLIKFPMWICPSLSL